MICNRRAFVLATGCTQVSVDLSFPDLEYCSTPDYTEPKPCEQCTPQQLPEPDINFPGAEKCFSVYVTIDQTIEFAKKMSIGTARLTSSEDCVMNEYSLYIKFKAPCILKNVTADALFQRGGKYRNRVIGEIHMEKTVCIASVIVNITGITEVAYDAAPPRVNFHPEITFTGSIGINAPNIRFWLKAISLPDMSKGTQVEDVCKLTVLFNFKAHRPDPKEVLIEYIPQISRGWHTIDRRYMLKYESGPNIVKWQRGVVNLPDPITLYMTASGEIFNVDGEPGGDWHIGWHRPHAKITGPTGFTGDTGPTGLTGENGKDLDPEDMVVCTYFYGWGEDKQCGPRCIIKITPCGSCTAPCNEQFLYIYNEAAYYTFDVIKGFGDYDDEWNSWFSCDGDAVNLVCWHRGAGGPYYNDPGYDTIEFCAYMAELYTGISSIFD